MNKYGLLKNVLLFVSICLALSLAWVEKTFYLQSLNQIIYHMKFISGSFDMGIFYDYLIKVIPTTVFIFIICIKMKSYLKNHKYKKVIHYDVYLCIFIIVVSLVIACSKFQVIAYFENKSELSDFYQTSYVDPKKTSITFKENKHNLIHIYLESVEMSYLSQENGGYYKESLMPELEQLALDNINFAQNDRLGGSTTLEGTQWTTASIIAQTSGITSSLSLSDKVYDDETPFLPGAYTLAQVLEENGYQYEMIMGSDVTFGGISQYYNQHGHCKMMDYNGAKEAGYIPEDYHVFWGYEDQKMFEIAKQEILNLSKQEGYFSVEMMTIDTHAPHGYICEKCPKLYDDPMKNIIACQSQQVYDFVLWLQQQDFYKDTTIVITGDHNSMSGEFFKDYDQDYIRKPYHCIINSVVEPQQTKNRLFNVVDMYPTILASIGANIEGERLGIGTNLFSDQQTLLEEYGLDKVSQELSKTDLFYQKELLQRKP